MYEHIESFKNTKDNLLYHAVCTDCHEIIHIAPNGAFVESYAKMHIAEKPLHRVVVGFVLADMRMYNQYDGNAKTGHPKCNANF